MHGHEGSPYWAVVDFDSEGDDVPSPPPNHRIYLDPWDNDAQGIIQDNQEGQQSSHEENLNSFAGEPVSASFYYVPTKNYDSAEEPPLPPPRRKMTPHDNRLEDEDYAIYGRKLSRSIIQDVPTDHSVYGERPVLGRRRSVYVEEPIYMPHPMVPMIYEPMYGGLVPPPPGYLPPRPKTRMSISHPPYPHHPDYMALHGKPRRPSRMSDAYDLFLYESLPPEYEDWARPFPKSVPDNFHLSRYGHLQIDYSFSWHSLDRLIRST